MRLQLESIGATEFCFFIPRGVTPAIVVFVLRARGPVSYRRDWGVWIHGAQVPRGEDDIASGARSHLSSRQNGL